MIEPTHASPSEEKIKLLVADDDTPTRILLRAAISQWGYEVIEAKDGEEAWDLMNKGNPPRLLILDWLMPKLDGISLCKRCKTELSYHPYIILLTQVSGNSNLLTGLEAGADEFLSKPFNMPELRSRLAIGARIIHASQYSQKQQSYINQIETLHNAILTISEQGEKNAQINNFPSADREKIGAIQNGFKEITKLIKQFVELQK